MEVLLAGALAPAPPPVAALVEPDLLPELPADVASLVTLLPRADLVDHIRRLTGVHLALYLLKVFRIAVDAETSNGTRTPCETVHATKPDAACPYRLELLVDCGEDARSPIAKLAEISWAGEEEWLARYI